LQEECFFVSEAVLGQEIEDFLIKHLADLGIHPQTQRYKAGRDNLTKIISFGSPITLTSEATIAAIFPGVVCKKVESEVLLSAGSGLRAMTILLFAGS
jgi:hypothetical protein